MVRNKTNNTDGNAPAQTDNASNGEEIFLKWLAECEALAGTLAPDARITISGGQFQALVSEARVLADLRVEMRQRLGTLDTQVSTLNGQLQDLEKGRQVDGPTPTHPTP